MKLTYGSLFYFGYILFAILLMLILFFVLRKRTVKTQKIVILSLIMLNFIQHVTKAWFWYPLYHGKFDLLEITLCNICATNIFLSPFIFLSKNKFAKDALFFFGTLGGIGSLICPFNFENREIFSQAYIWDFIRFYSCHVIIFTTSILPVMLGLHHIKLKRFWMLGISYLILEGIVLADNIFIGALSRGITIKESYDIIYNNNPLWISHPPIASDALGRLFALMKLDWAIYDPTKTYIPVIYSSFIVYPMVTLIAVISMPLLSKIKQREDEPIFKR